MKAAVIRKYGSTDVFHNEEVELPKIKSDELLIKVHASSINPIDWKIRKGMLKFITGNKFPMILGMDVSGEVVQFGSQVTKFKIGEQIYACLNVPGGGYAEYAAVPEKLAALKPNNISYEEAAVVPLAAMTSLQALRDQGQIKAGQSVLINGASSGVGTFAVQIAKVLGAEVTGVCSSRNIDLVKSLGADRIIDYNQQDFTQEKIQYDIVFDAVAKSSFSNCKKILKANGVYCTTLPSPEIVIQGFLTGFLPGQKAKFILLSSNSEDLMLLSYWIESGKIRSVVDRTFSLDDIAAAHAYSESERAVGKIAIAVSRKAAKTQS
ncbi:MAG: NAD(P)-dependent alcohol dehydrogenase [Scytonematopsis contorta HA4267-MV1]|jgi:NADPH:quinone reductase-like Zn-dependent oxidoreductase|nr:NAD(P)-dependent alcohol dehydrogenase [Scytonematopsis contorta HA4267-MV1]